ncbi:MAG: carbamoyl phosphate synthase large subunit, partial [Pseudomonadota bacterium]
AYYKAQEAAQQTLPSEGTVLITVADHDKQATVEVARRFSQLGFKLMTTGGTAQYLADQGIKTEKVQKVHEGRPNIADMISNGEIQLIINTPSGRWSKQDDSYIRKAAIKHKIPYITTAAAAHAAAKGIAAFRTGYGDVKSVQEYHGEIKFP